MFIKKHWMLFLNLLLLLFLLAKNPFSQRTLIPNFEPYPDSIHYIVPARSAAQGREFAIVREERTIKPSVPLLYSAFLTPFFMVNSDPRFFYFANVFLSIAGLILLYTIIRKLLSNHPSTSLRVNQLLTTNHLILFVSLFLYVTNYFIYWYPTLAMAENLTLFLFLLNVYLIVLPTNRITIVLAGIIPFCFFLTKYANIPLTATFLLMFTIKLFLDMRATKNKKNNRLMTYALLFGGSIFTTLLVMVFTESIPGLTTLGSRFANFFPVASSKTTSTSGGGWFSIQYMKEYLPTYFRAMLGGYSVRFLWDNTPIWPLYVGTVGLIGLFIGTFKIKTRLLSCTLLLTLFSSILFMAAFYSQDMRYLYQMIPALLIGFVIFWDAALSFPRRPASRLGGRESRLILTFLLILLFIFYSATNAIRLKKQIMLNLKYAETPWYYISVLELNKYFSKTPKSVEKLPVVISSLIPYYIDFYSNKNYSLLPLSLSQDFQNARKEAWGNFNYSNLIILYHKVLLSKYPLYIHNYGLKNEKVLHDDFKKIQDTFKLELVQTGCYNACNIWRLRERD